MRDRVGVVLVPASIGFEVAVQRRHAAGPRAGGLEADAHPVVGERVPLLAGVRVPGEVAPLAQVIRLCRPPHALQRL